MWLLVAWLAATAASVSTMYCNDARLKCAYRTGCGAAISNYIVQCSDVLSNPTSKCPQPCQHAIIALISTEEGKQLMDCKCGEDEYCIESKRNIEVCRSEVLRGVANETASCRLSQLICSADAQCATALEYSNRLCRAAYRGRKCSYKCMNSIEILRKQEKAAPLSDCYCDGHEDYDCPRMMNNLNRLCNLKHKKHPKVLYEGVNKKTHNEVIEERQSSAHALHTSLVLWCSVLVACLFT